MHLQVEFKIKNLSIDVLLKDVHYCGKCKFVVELDKTKVFPCITRVFITLMERPKVGVYSHSGIRNETWKIFASVHR